MELLPEIVARRARRAMAFRAVDDGVVERILRAATLAPSCSNNQPWRLVAVTGASELERLREALSRGNAWAKRSPCVIVVATKPDLDCRLEDRRDYALFDVGLAVGNLMIQATREGLYAHPIAGYRPEVVKQALGIPGEYVVVALVIVGHPGDEAELSEKQRASEHDERLRKPMADVAARDRWAFVEAATPPP
jgi:nitroreductase